MFGQGTAQPTTAEARVGQLISALPVNSDILETEVDHMYEHGEIAVFNDRAAAVPVATTTKRYAGTTGVNSCVAVLIRGKRGNTLGLGSIHLSAVDMATSQTVSAALTRLWNLLIQRLGGNPDAHSCDIFAVGGSQAVSTSWDEFERVLIGCQQLNPLVRLAGAVLPINSDSSSVEVYIEEEGVSYAFEGGSESD
jgi:hypothetical protein